MTSSPKREKHIDEERLWSVPLAAGHMDYRQQISVSTSRHVGAAIERADQVEAPA